MHPNINPKTQIAYGYVAANNLDSDVVDMIHNNQTKDLDFHGFMLDKLGEENYKLFLDGETNDEIDEAVLEYENCESSEYPNYEAEYKGVKLISSWLGGALHYFVVESPIIADNAKYSSPCVPNAGILSKNMDGSVMCYGVPDDWWQAD